jgi:hypothetical protein
MAIMIGGMCGPQFLQLSLQFLVLLSERAILTTLGLQLLNLLFHLRHLNNYKIMKTKIYISARSACWSRTIRPQLLLTVPAIVPPQHYLWEQGSLGSISQITDPLHQSLASCNLQPASALLWSLHAGGPESASRSTLFPARPESSCLGILPPLPHDDDRGGNSDLTPRFWSPYLRWCWDIHSSGKPAECECQISQSR